MSKLRADSIWAGITAEQRELLEGWLFVENLTYREVLERAEKEFGVKTSVSAVQRFYVRQARERRLADLMEAKSWAGAAAGKEDVGYATMKLFELAAYELALAEPDKMKLDELSWLMKMLMQNRKHTLREKKFGLAEERLRFRVLVKKWARDREFGNEMDFEEMMELLKTAREYKTGYEDFQKESEESKSE